MPNPPELDNLNPFPPYYRQHALWNIAHNRDTKCPCGVSPKECADPSNMHCASRWNPDSFDQFWAIYPKRKGSNPKSPAKKKFTKLVNSGEDADSIIAGAKEYAIQMAEIQKINTEYVAHALTWLNQCRWKDYEMGEPTYEQRNPPVRLFVEVDTPQWEAWTTYRRRLEGRSWPEKDFQVNGHYRRGWWFETEWPPQQ